MSIDLFFAAFMIACCASVAAADSPGPGRIFQPTDYASPSGAYVLHVDPGRSDGKGPAKCRMTQEGEAQWEREMPITLWGAAVTNDGTAIGYGYSESKSETQPKSGLHLMHLIAIDVSGEVRFDRQTRRKWNASFGQLPAVRQFVVSQERDRVLLQVNEQHGVVERNWWIYELSSGKRLDNWQLPAPLEDLEHGQLRLVDARALPSTDLILFQWRYWDRESTKSVTHYGSLYALMDGDDEVVWKLARPLDFSVLGDQAASKALLEASWIHSTILGCERDGHFALWYPSESMRADFTARRDGETWSVELTGTRPLDLRMRTTWQAPELELEVLPTIQLGAANDDKSNDSRPKTPRNASIDQFGQILISGASDNGSVFVFDREGKHLSVCRAPQASGLQLSGPCAVDDRGIIHVPTIQDVGYHSHMRFAPAYGAVGEVDLRARDVEFDPHQARYWRRNPEDAFRLERIGSGGLAELTVARRPDKKWWRNIRDFDLSSDGATLAVLEARRDGYRDRDLVLAIFDGNGENGTQIELPDMDASCVSASRDWIALTDYHTTVMLVDRRDASLHRLPLEPSANEWTWGFSPEGDELWGVEAAALTLHRFALPTD